jgi:hypothetical protein
VLPLTVVGMLRGMSEASGPGNKAQPLKAQVTQKAREVRVQALAKAPQLTGAVAQQAQRVVQDKRGPPRSQLKASILKARPALRVAKPTSPTTVHVAR